MARPLIKKGMSGKKGTEIGEAILLWRSFLGKPDLKPAPGTTTYDFGALTEKYTKEFQTSIGLKPTGIVDADTWNSYDTRMSVAPAPVAAKAAAVEAKGEAEKAAAMIAAVAKSVAKPPTAKPQPTASTATAAATAPKPVEAQVRKAVASVKDVATNVTARVKEKSLEMPMWQRILAGGVVFLGALVGYKAVKK